LLLAAPRNIRFGPGTNKYDFTYAPNLALMHVLEAENLLTRRNIYQRAAGKAFFVTNYEPVEFKKFLAWVHEADDEVLGRDKQEMKVLEIPIGVAKVLVWIGEKIAGILGREPVLSYKNLGDSVAERWFDNGKARRMWNYVPEMGLRESVRIAVEGYLLAKEREKQVLSQ
jgi:sterol-4alpha-carboxylate 3-dehydrogenase (decarboxylating)